jgi:HD-like signal output (HDOD) protein/CheY-like chemotaxis protein
MTSLHVLFVDDEQAILDGLRNSLRKERKRWDMTFALGGQQALEEMKKTPADVVITDMRMPGMDGAELLRHIQRDFPAAARIVLSGQAERESIMRALPVTHQFLHKPCDGETLRAVIEQTHALHKLMQNPALTALVGKLERIPAVPSTYTELSRLAADPKSDSAGFAKVIEMDVAVCAKVLQLVNSAYFGLGQKIVSIRPAVTYLGVEIIKSLVLSSTSFSDKAISEVKGFSPDRLQQHSMLTAVLAKKIVSNPALADAAFTAGLLHDIGALVLLHAAPPDYVRALERKKELKGDSAAAEREIFGVTHAEVGAYLLGLWGIPFPIVEAVAFHHRPNEVAPESRALVAAVHMASGLVEEMTDADDKSREPGSDIDSSGRIDVSFLREAGLEESFKSSRTEAEKLFSNASSKG